MSDLSIWQHSYLAVGSKVLSSQEIEDILMLKADKHAIWGKGRLRIDPSYQVTNVWKLVSDKLEPVDNQIEKLIKRIAPVRDRLIELTRTSDITVSLQIVRHFDDPEGEQEIIDEDEALVKLPGQHQLLGWHLTNEVINFLHETGAELDVDEYN